MTPTALEVLALAGLDVATRAHADSIALLTELESELHAIVDRIADARRNEKAWAARAERFARYVAQVRDTRSVQPANEILPSTPRISPVK